MKKKSPVFRIIGIAIGVILLVAAVFLTVTAMVFSFGNKSSAPDIFGYNIYMVNGSDFYQLKAGDAAIAQKVWPDEIQSGEIIIYHRTDGKDAQLGKVNTATLKEGIMSFDIETETHETATITQSQLVARVCYTSHIIGAVINFAMSPFGVMTVAILPCLAIVAFEITRFFLTRHTPEIEPVRIQLESPTFLPEEERKRIDKKREEEKQENTKLAKEKKILEPSKSEPVSRTDEFTERLRAKSQAAKDADKVKDRVELSAKAKKAAGQKPSENKPAEHKPEKVAVAAVNIKSNTAPVGDTKEIPIPRKEQPKAESVPQPKAEEKPVSSEPDLSLVFKNDEDKRYDIDDILADIDRRHK